MSDKVRFAIIGTGMIAERLIPRSPILKVTAARLKTLEMVRYILTP